MQWIVLMTRPDSYLPRTHGEKAHLNVMAINIEANSELEAHWKAMEIAETMEDQKWMTIAVIAYNPLIHDNFQGYEEEFNGDVHGG